MNLRGIDMMNAPNIFTIVLALQFFSGVAGAESWLTLDAADYPAEVKNTLDDVRDGCREAGQRPSDDPQAGVTVIDLNHDGSKDILLDAWHACDVPIKGGACNTGGCDVKIYKQIGDHRWKLIFDQTLGEDWFLSASQEGYFQLMAVSVSRKITDRCPDPSGNVCDYLLYWKKNEFVWNRIH